MTKSILRKATVVGAMAAGAILISGAGAAQAAPDLTSAGNDGIGNGNQLLAPVQVPVNVCGNSVAAVLALANAQCDGGSDADINGGDEGTNHSSHHGMNEDGALADMTTAGNSGILNGNQAQVPVQVPVNVCGNSVAAVLALANAQCDGGADADINSDDKGGAHHGKQEASAVSDMTTVGNSGIGNGNQLQVPVQVPVNVCGNSVAAVLALANAQCDGGADADINSDDKGGAHHGKQEASAVSDMTTVGNEGILNGNQAEIPVQVPVNVCGNSVAAVLAMANAQCDGGASADLGDDTDQGRHHDGDHHDGDHKKMGTDGIGDEAGLSSLLGSVAPAA
jgi:hypothetical protein